MITLDNLYGKDASIVSREIAGETILVPIRKNVGDLESIYTLNPTAARIWSLLDGQRSLAAMLELVVAEFEVDPEVAKQDLFELVSQLESIGAVVKL